MKILIQAAKIIDTNSSFHKKEKNILLHNGHIAAIGDKNYQADKVINAKGMIISPGWFDLGTFIGDPGLESKEDLESGSNAAIAGGFTEIAVLPNTVPCIQTKNDVNYLLKGNESRLLQIYPLASVTKNNKGEELTEMIDLHTAGAIGFTDGLKTLWHTDIVLKSLQYLQTFNGVLIDHPEDIWLNMFGQMHEGVTSTMLGMKGMPRIAEEIAIRRNVELLNYAGGRLHVSRLSSKRSIELLRIAKKKLNITCDITCYQPLLEDALLTNFDTNYKVNPPLREKRDNDALIKGLKDGTIDVICSGHTPQDEESKNIEFDIADAGIISLQTFASNLVSLSKFVAWEDLITKVTANPRNILNLISPKVEEKEKANLTLLNPTLEWTFNDQTNYSKSKNSPWLGKTITGKVVAVFNNNKHWIA